MGLYGEESLSGNEVFFDEDEIIVSKTDLTGRLTYGNRTFYRLAGLSEKECIGQQHNIIRHPEMPRGVFELLWKNLKDEKELFAYVNNRSANGDNYWVFAHITPSLDGGGNVCGYHSNRRVPNREVINQHIIPLYTELLAIEKAIASPKEAVQASYLKIQSILKEQNIGFNQWMFALGG